MLTKLLAFRFSRQPAGLFITHVLNDRVLRHFARIKSECGALIDWHLIHNTWTLTEISRRNTRCPKLLPKARLDQAIQNGSFVMGYLDVLFTPLAFETGRSFVWICEYDVDFSGRWFSFFRQFQGNQADLLATTLNPEYLDPTWAFWKGSSQPSTVSPDLRTRSFLPLFRISRKLLTCYRRVLSNPDWKGHYEFLLPTVARAHGFIIEDIGGHGPFTPEHRKGFNYVNTPDDPFLRPGTFRFRPSMARYYHECAADFDKLDVLYHPVKPGIAEWSPETRALPCAPHGD